MPLSFGQPIHELCGLKLKEHNLSDKISLKQNSCKKIRKN